MGEFVTGVMIAEPVKKLDGQDRELYDAVVYWHSERPAETSPYRAIVKWIIAELQKQYRIDIRYEDPETEGEEIVYHDVVINGRDMSIYWENTLGFVSFISSDPNIIEEASNFLAGKKPLRS